MSNPISTNINNISQLLDSQNQNIIESYDLSDDRFSNILDSKLGEYTQEDSESKDITTQLGIPAGLEIEGFDYNSIVNDIDSVDIVDAVNTDSNISQNNGFDLGSLIKDAGQTVSNITSNQRITNPINSTVQEVQNFWKNQASNFYSIMNKDTVNDISELISKL
ncbi:MAG: hypothetical protein ACI4S3_05725 [Candidatus Gastranaerophilaceae bacterium]